MDAPRRGAIAPEIITVRKIVALPGNWAVNKENKHQPAVYGETGLLDSNN
jgi:hypothetical protein